MNYKTVRWKYRIPTEIRSNSTELAFAKIRQNLIKSPPLKFGKIMLSWLRRNSTEFKWVSIDWNSTQSTMI